MPIVAQIIGGAGTGKTEELLRLMELCDRDPMEIGLVSFTRNARRVAATRAAARFGVAAVDLEQHGWFRTLHSICHRQLGIAPKQLIGATAADRRWLGSALAEPCSGASGDPGAPAA